MSPVEEGCPGLFPEVWRTEATRAGVRLGCVASKRAKAASACAVHESQSYGDDKLPASFRRAQGQLHGGRRTQPGQEQP
eukprot:6552872-Lingulodinium_polyedra.AAC.1